VHAPVGNIGQYLAGIVAWKLALACIKPFYKASEYKVICHNGNIVDPTNVKHEFNKYEEQIKQLLLTTAILGKLSVEYADPMQDIDNMLKAAIKSNLYYYEANRI